MRRNMGAGRRRITARTKPLGILVASCLCVVGSGSVLAPAAQAGAGNFCEWYTLKPGYVASCMYGPHSYYYEVETWNSDGKGLGSCASVGSGSVCSTAFGSGYNEAYCKSSCRGQSGQGYVGNNNPSYTSVFTGWEWWK
jgi:hypothetical protein